MKAEELIIGDLVLYFGKVFSILKVDPETELSIIEDARHFEEANINDLSPISLTPEILEKNGWNKRHDPTSSCDIYSKGKGAFYVSLEQSIYKKQEGFDFVVADSTYRFGNKLQYVHELQHILWALREDANLKI